MYGLDLDDCRRKLKQWRKDWNPETIDKWKDAQVVRIYRREQQKQIQGLLDGLGLQEAKQKQKPEPGPAPDWDPFS